MDRAALAAGVIQADLARRPVDGRSAVRPESVRQLGLVIGDGQAGVFALALRSIALE